MSSFSVSLDSETSDETIRRLVTSGCGHVLGLRPHQCLMWWDRMRCPSIHSLLVILCNYIMWAYCLFLSIEYIFLVHIFCITVDFIIPVHFGLIMEIV